MRRAAGSRFCNRSGITIKGAVSYKIGTMIEVPRAALVAGGTARGTAGRDRGSAAGASVRPERARRDAARTRADVPQSRPAAGRPLLRAPWFLTSRL